MPTRDRTDRNYEPGSPVPNEHYTATRFRDRVRPDDVLRGHSNEYDPAYSVKRMLDGHILTVGPINDVQSNPLCYPEDVVDVSTANDDWVE